MNKPIYDYKVDNANTKELIRRLENPLISNLNPALTNLVDHYIEFVKHGKENAYKVDFDFDVYLSSIGENLQRGLVWEQSKQISYIQTVFIRGFILQPIVVNRVVCDGFKVIKVIDGKQRLTAIKAFMNNEFNVCGFYYSDVSQGFESHISRLVFEWYYDELNDAQLAAIFDKVNFLSELQDVARFEKIKQKLNEL